MADYFDATHARQIEALQRSFASRTEWPTWLVIVAIHGGWLAVLSGVGSGLLSLAVAMPALILLAAWHLSLQHELVHGHPTRSERLNALLGSVPVSAWYPFAVYRADHLRHHRASDLTAPGDDPESNYVTLAQWARWPAWRRAIWTARKSVVGRFVFGPPMSVLPLYANALSHIVRGDLTALRTWTVHLMSIVALLAFVQHVSGIAWWVYLLGVAWPALSIAMLRSLYEHRAAQERKQRIAINEAGFAMRLLFLNNNYHAVHHDLPHLAWFQLRRAWQLRRADYAAANGGFVIRGYAALLRRHAWRPTDTAVHPFIE